MSKSKSVQFTINTAGGPRSLFTVDERKDGGLIVIARGGDLQRELGQRAVQPGPTLKGGRGALGIAQRRISIHPSPESEDGNQIHLTMKMEDGEELHRHHFTKAVKQTNRFAFVQAHAFARLTHQANLPKNRREIVPIGEYDDGVFSILTLLLVSARDRQFQYEAHDFNYIPHVFGRFSLTLLWSFAYVPPGGSHNDIIMDTKPEAASNPIEAQLRRNLMEGLDEAGAVRIYDDCRAMFRDDYLRLIRNGSGPRLTPEVEQLAQLGHYKRGKDDSDFLAELRTRLRMRALIPSPASPDSSRGLGQW